MVNEHIKINIWNKWLNLPSRVVKWEFKYWKCSKDNHEQLVKCAMIHSFLKSLFLLYFYAKYSNNIFNYLQVEGFFDTLVSFKRTFWTNRKNKQKQPNPLRQEGGKIQKETCWFSHNTYCCTGPWLCLWATQLYREWNTKSKAGAGIWFSWALVSHTVTFNEPLYLCLNAPCISKG